MVTKTQLRKNRFDLEFKAESQHSNILFTLGTISALGFFGLMIINGQYVLGSVATFIISVLALIFYKQSRNKMSLILTKIKKLEK